MSKLDIYLFLAILVMAVVTFFTRVLPFFLSNLLRNHHIKILARYLPVSIMLILSIYSVNSLQSIDANYLTHGTIAVVVTLILHLAFKNVLLSILLGTFFYYIILNYPILGFI